MIEPCPIRLDHGVIGNGRVLALVSPTTQIEWLCMPRFGSASLRYRHKDDFGETMTHANCVGVFSEDIEPKTGMLLGTFPQAYTHVGLINTAVTISELLEARDARFRAWS